jgi:hypothetical protein
MHAQESRRSNSRQPANGLRLLSVKSTHRATTGPWHPRSWIRTLVLSQFSVNLEGGGQFYSNLCSSMLVIKSQPRTVPREVGWRNEPLYQVQSTRRVHDT